MLTKDTNPLIIAGHLHKARREQTLRNALLPKIDYYLHFSSKRDTGYVDKGLRGEVVCEYDVGLFDVAVRLDDVQRYLEGKGVKFTGSSGAIGCNKYEGGG